MKDAIESLISKKEGRNRSIRKISEHVDTFHLALVESLAGSGARDLPIWSRQFPDSLKSVMATARQHPIVNKLL